MASYLCRGLILLPMVLGCGSPRTFPVEGTVFFEDKKPAKELAGGWVLFESMDGKVSAQGEIDSEGNYRLTTTKPGDGAYPGEYRVAVRPRMPANPEGPQPPAVIDARFTDSTRSNLKATVETRANQIPLTVQRAKR